MKSFLKRLFNGLYDIVFTIIDLMFIAFSTGVYDYRGKKNHSRPVRVLANGPSLPQEFDAGEVDYCMLNDSPRTEMFWRLKPSYYIVCDPLYFSSNLGEHETEVYKRLRDNLDWKLTVFVPIKYKKKACSLFGGMSVEIVPFRGGLLKDIHSNAIKSFMYKKGLALPRVQNVVVGAIGCLIGVGYKEIELYGVDHSWLSAIIVNEDNVVCLSDFHYYDKNARITPWYKVSGEPYKLYEVLRDLSNTFASYWDLRLYADSMGVKVINKTKRSYIDAFERASY